MRAVHLLAENAALLAIVAGVTAVLLVGLAVWVRKLLKRGRR